MSRAKPSPMYALLLIACALCLAPRNLSAQSPPLPNVSVYDLVERGRQALLADKYEDSLAALREAMTRPEFQKAEAGLQYFAVLLASFAAVGADDNLSAYEYIMVATSFPDADGDVWVRRAGIASMLDKWDDAALSLTTAARKWPKALKQDQYHGRLVFSTVRELGQQATLRKQRLDLLNALFEAKYKLAYDNEPSYLWMLLATDAIERKDLARAREISSRITDSSTLVAMRIDKRFDTLVAREGKIFDVRAAAERNVRRLKQAMKDHPRELGAVVQFAYALHTVGKFDEMNALADEIIAKVDEAPQDKPLYDDLDEHLSWIHNHKATALRSLGRWDEAADVLAGWKRSKRNSDDKVSQAINLGFFYNELGRPQEALDAIEGLDWSRGMSEYGRTQCQFVRFQAFMQLGRTAEAQEVVTWMRQHQADSMQTAQGTLLESGDVDGAAALLISRLRDAEERSTALAEVQTYAQTPRTERQKKLDTDREALLARPDVVAAIAEYGRREKFPIYSLEY